jgi:membrane fusion protein, multidrug efflux system
MGTRSIMAGSFLNRDAAAPCRRRGRCGTGVTGRLAAVFVVLGVLCGVVACGDEKEASGSAGSAGRGGREGRRPPTRQAAIPVRTEPVVVGEMVASVQTHARLEAERWVSVLARTTGLVEELLAEEGDHVAEHQVLARLETAQLRLRLEQSEVALNQVQASHARIKTLHDNRMVSDAEYETTRNQLENAQVALQEVRLNLDYADIRAPLSGVIMQRLVEVGDLVRSNQELFALADLEPLLARVHVPEKRMHQIRMGQEARLRIESLPGVDVVGSIRMISPGVDPQSGTVKVTLAVPDTEHQLKPGMFTAVRIITDSHPHALIIPKKALLIETDEDDVFIAVDGKAQRVGIELGFTEGDRIEVLSGLREGDQVITVGTEGLKNGTPVRAVGLGLAPAVLAAGDTSGAAGSGEAWAGRPDAAKQEAVARPDSGTGKRPSGDASGAASPGRRRTDG